MLLFRIFAMLALLTTAFCAWREQLTRRAVFFALAAVIYSAGGQLPTILVNVPMNRAMEALPIPPDIEAATEIWRSYSTRWQWWNMLRTIGSSIALLLTGWGLLLIPARMA